MGERGPTGKPTELNEPLCNVDHVHVSTCYPGRRLPNQNEPKPPQVTEAPDPPDFLCDESQTEWLRTVPDLCALNLVTILDYNALVLMFSAHHHMTKAWQFLADNGYSFQSERGCYIQYPHVAVWQKNADLYRKMLNEFGMTPAARSRIQVVIKAPEQTQQSNDDKSLFRNTNSNIPGPATGT